MSDFIFVTEKTESDNNKFRTGTTYTKGAKKTAGKRSSALLARKSKEKHQVDD